MVHVKIHYGLTHTLEGAKAMQDVMELHICIKPSVNNGPDDLPQDLEQANPPVVRI